MRLPRREDQADEFATAAAQAVAISPASAAAGQSEPFAVQ
jgi:hypothetical protein